MGYWLLKSEPSVFSFDDLKNAPGRRTHWEGVRNYQARNFMRDQMRVGDLAFFYHSSCEIPAIVGIVKVISPAYPDHTAWDPESPYFDPKSTPENPRWFMVDVRYQRKLKRPIPLSELKQQKKLRDFALLRRGNRLSIMPVTPAQWQAVLALE